MNCRNCSTRINYNYISECPKCGGAVEESDLPKLDPSTRLEKQNRVWLCRLENVIYVLLTSALGMISGAVVTYFGAAVIYIAVSSPETFPGQHCGRGMAIGMMSILSGAFLGTIGGTAFAVKHLIPHSVSNSSL